MRTGRPAKASTIYKVSIHNNGGRRYASTQPYTVDENGKKHYTHKHCTIVANLTALLLAKITARLVAGHTSSGSSMTASPSGKE